MYLYNTLTRKKEEFKPAIPGEVRMYTCGPTVYLYASIGNFKTYVFSDVLRRTLEYNGLSVTHVMNITDVGHLVSDADEGEDKVVAEAARQNKTPWEIAEFYTQAFFRDADRLNILRPTIICKATDHIPHMIRMVEEIVANGYGYETDEGIYFDVSKYPEYGRLSGINLEKQMAGARVEVKTDKRNAADFLLWRKAPKEHIMQWESPWGMGYPGWHIECSAMSREYLGDQFDIHTGGIDHIPIHHENEIAQSWACSGQIPARFWLHGEFLLVDGGKMSKSLNNVYLLDDLAARGYEPLAFRYFCLGAHYRTKLNFTWDAIAGAQTGLRGLRAQVQRAVQSQGSVSEVAEQKVAELKAAFLEAINDDLNTPRALAVVWEAAKSDLGPALRDLVADFDRVLGLDLLTGQAKDEQVDESELPAEVAALLKERAEARKAKDWAKADSLREKLREMGYAVKDVKDGYEVTKI
ncbi:MAG TPA: cysteine--tRNA ligase [Firmicutes bacterium]|nr:cysteine--tRNA ligase [Candidatus Fermentithermobacillaceae bacterium]